MLSVHRSLRSRWYLAILLFAIGFASQGIPSAAQAGFERANLSGNNNGSWVNLPGNVHWMARRQYDQGRAPDNQPQRHILMLLKRAPQQESALDQFIAQQYDPRSANFHKWLTPAEFGARFGVASSDLSRLLQWMQQQGFRVNHVAEGRTFIDFDATAGQLGTVFHTEIHRYRINGKDHFANATDPSIPATFASVVSGFRALNDFHPQRRLPNSGAIDHFDPGTKKWSRLASKHLSGGTGLNAGFIVGPSDFAQIYGVNQAWQQIFNSPSGPQTLVGTGQTIAVVGDTTLDSADIQSFRDQFGTTALGPNGSVQFDSPPASVCNAPDPSMNDPEGYLDAEWSGAMAPDATIDFVACDNSGVTLGADLAAAYVVQDAAHAQRDSILSSSFGYCEREPISESNAFYESLWQQAAVEGITVVVAAGDSGPAECDEFTDNNYATTGQGVSAEASTPYDIAAGGTDFSDVFSGTTGTYWASTNGANLASAKSYIPETTWNDSCASPLILQDFGQGYTSSSGSDGFCTFASQQPPDPDTGLTPYFNFYAGSGGLSTIYPRPAWQAGVAGIPQTNARALPDISMFASAGFTWGHALIYCDSAYLPSGYSCDYSNPNNYYFSESGGTSFVAPAFSGILALIVQKNGRQGQANNVLYPLAGQQFIESNSTTQPNLATCAAYLGTGALASCYFHDISATPNPDPATRAQTPFLTGTITIPCIGSATSPGVYTDTSTNPASNNEDCYNYQITVTAQDGTNTTSPDYFGVSATAGNPSSPAFLATPGYDLATGLGSPNVAALVNAPQWSTGSLLTTVTLSPANSVIAPAQAVTLTATVAVNPGGAPVRGGSVTFYSSGVQLGTVALSCMGTGTATLTVAGTSFGPAGVYGDVYAVYSGGAQLCRSSTVPYFGSQSSPVTVTVAQAVAAVTGAPVYTAAQCCFFAQPYPLKVTVTGGATVSPGGSVVVHFNGATIGTGTLAPASANTSTATILLNAATLATGNNALSLQYSGDVDYLPATGAATAAIRNPAVPFGVVALGSTSEIDVTYTFVTAGSITLNFNPLASPTTDYLTGRRGSCVSGMREAAGHMCTIGILFRPSQPGIRNGAVQVAFTPSGGSGSAASFYLFPSGIGGTAQISLSTMTQVTLNSNLSEPQGAVFNPAGDTLFVANGFAAQIITVPQSGGTFTPWSTKGIQLQYPTDLTFDGLGEFLIADQEGSRVIAFPPTGAGRVVGTGSISLQLPTALRSDGAGNLYIADPGLVQIVSVPTQGSAAQAIDLGGQTLGYPEALAVDNAEQNLYVADGDTNQITQIPLNDTSNAGPLAIAPCANTVAPCSLNNPSGIAFNLNGDMYVADGYNSRILMLPRTHVSNSTPTTLLPLSGLSAPSSVALDSAGNLYIPDVGTGSLYKLLIASGSIYFGGKTNITIPVTVTNVGNENLNITALNFAQGNRSRFSATSTCTRGAIAPGGTCTITVRAGTNGQAQDVLTLSSNASGPATISVNAGTAPAVAH